MALMNERVGFSYFKSVFIIYKLVANSALESHNINPNVTESKKP